MIKQQRLALPLVVLAATLAFCIAFGQPSRIAHADYLDSVVSLVWNPNDYDDLACGKLWPYGPLGRFDTRSAANNWRNAFSGRPHYPSRTQDEWITWSELTDQDEVSGGYDHGSNNADTKDAVFFGGHGYIPSTLSCDPTNNCWIYDWWAQLSSDQSNPGPYTCGARIYHMMLGDNNAEFAHLFACNSAERTLRNTIVSHSHRLHQWLGFYGTTATGNGTSNETDDFVDDAYDGAVAYAWLYNMVSWNHWYDSSSPNPSYKDVCPYIIIRGNSDQDAYNRRDESFGDSPLSSDPTGSGKFDVYYYLCDPNHPNNEGNPGMPMGEHYGF